MELEIKSRHLQRKTRSEVKNEHWHDMVKAYEELDQEQKTLTTEERGMLKAANEIYMGKGFEYFNPEYAVRGYSQFPALQALDDVAKKLISP